MKAEDSFGSSGRAPDEKDFRGGCALSDAARMEAEARSAILRWGYGNFVRELHRVSGDAAGGPWTDSPSTHPDGCICEAYACRFARADKAAT